MLLGDSMCIFGADTISPPRRWMPHVDKWLTVGRGLVPNVALTAFKSRAVFLNFQFLIPNSEFHILIRSLTTDSVSESKEI